MNDNHSRLKALQDDLERSLAIARTLRAELTAKSAHLNQAATDPVGGTHIPKLRRRARRPRSGEQFCV